jgi:hypothetical protein
VAHASNPSYTGSSDQDCGFKPAQANSSQDPLKKKKNPLLNRAGGMAQGEGPVFKPQYHKRK